MPLTSAATAQPSPAPLVVATPPAVAAGTTELRFVVPLGVADRVRQAAEQFNQQQTEIAVAIEALPASEGLATASTTGDCFFWSGTPTVEEQASLADLQPLLDAQGGNQELTLKEEYPPALLAAFSYSGRLLGLPATVNLPTLGYNREAFAGVGVAEPDTIWTSQVFVDTAAQLTRRQPPNPLYGYASTLPDLSLDMDLFFAWSQAEPVRYEEEVTVRFTAPEVIEAARLYLSLLQQSSPYGQLPGYDEQDRSAALPSQIAAGNVALWLNVANADLGLEPRDGFAPDVIPIKLSGALLASDFLQPGGFYISAGTAQVEACWAWITSLSGNDTLFPIAKLPDRPLQLPARRSVAERAITSGVEPAERAAVEGAYLSLFSQPPAERSQQRQPNDVVVDYYWGVVLVLLPPHQDAEHQKSFRVLPIRRPHHRAIGDFN